MKFNIIDNHSIFGPVYWANNGGWTPDLTLAMKTDLIAANSIRQLIRSHKPKSDIVVKQAP